MRWWLLAALSGCSGNAYRPIDEISPVDCTSSLSAVETYGAVEVLGKTIEFDSPFCPPQHSYTDVLVQDGEALLSVSWDNGTPHAGLSFHDHIYGAASARLIPDCYQTNVLPAGRFEAHFSTSAVTGDVSGWWRNCYALVH